MTRSSIYGWSFVFTDVISFNIYCDDKFFSSSNELLDDSAPSSCMDQREIVGLITQRPVDRNYL